MQQSICWNSQIKQNAEKHGLTRNYPLVGSWGGNGCMQGIQCASSLAPQLHSGTAAAGLFRGIDKPIRLQKMLHPIMDAETTP